MTKPAEETAKAREQRISEIAEREKNATKGPWKAMIDGGSAWIESEKETVLPFFPPAKGSNVSFITHARMDIPFLLEALESERSSAIKEARELPSHEDIKKVLGNGWKGFKLNDEDDLDFVIGQIRLAIMKCYALRGER